MSSPESELLPPGPDGFVTFMYYFGLTSLIASVTIAQIRHLDLGQPTPYQYAFILGVIGGVWGTYFNRSVTLELTDKKVSDMLVKLEAKLQEMGFTECEHQEGLRIYSPPVIKALFMGKVRMLVREKYIKIVGRAVHIQALKQCLEES